MSERNYPVGGISPQASVQKSLWGQKMSAEIRSARFPGPNYMEIFMPDNLTEQLEMIEKEFTNFYSNIKNNDEYYSKSKTLKNKIISLITEAKKRNNQNAIDKSLKLLFDNSGSHIDLKILQEITPPLFTQGILTNDLFKEYLSKSPLSRWL